jgi:bifunctional pyridoxal-dependent enzyme with beta-cystathionase and maltose regulon repressor activities
MITYQLPSGKVINITVEEFLNLTDLDIQNLTASGLGVYANSPWYNSVIKITDVDKKKIINKNDDIEYYLDEDDVLIADKNITDIITIDDLDIENIIDNDYEDDYT